MIVVRYPLVPRPIPRERLTLEDAAARVGLHPVLVERFVEFGLIEPVEQTGVEMLFDPSCLPRLIAISRLRADLGVNLHGVAVILDLVDRLAVLQRELTWRNAGGGSAHGNCVQGGSRGQPLSRPVPSQPSLKRRA